jgi:hypothetical protein
MERETMSNVAKERIPHRAVWAESAVWEQQVAGWSELLAHWAHTVHADYRRSDTAQLCSGFVKAKSNRQD